MSFYNYVINEAKISLDKNKVKELLKFIDNKFDSEFSAELDLKSSEGTASYKSWDMNFDDEVQKFIDRECEDKFPSLTVYSWGRKVPEGLRREKMQVYIEIKPNVEKPKEKKMDNARIKDLFKDIDNMFDCSFSEDVVIKSDSAYSKIKTWSMELDSDIEGYIEALNREYPEFDVEVYGKNVPEGLSRWKREVAVEITIKKVTTQTEQPELSAKDKAEIERKQKEWENHNDRVRKSNKGED